MGRKAQTMGRSTTGLFSKCTRGAGKKRRGEDGSSAASEKLYEAAEERWHHVGLFEETGVVQEWACISPGSALLG